MFRQAKAVWPYGRENELNLAVAFEAKVDSLHNTELHVTSATFYRLYVNGRFVAFGPARTARGYSRVDVLSLDNYDNSTKNNLIRIEVVGYNCRSLSTCISTSFVCAELICDNEVIAYTGRDFTAYEMITKEQKVQRFSVQRHFGEVWDLTRKDIPLGMPTEISHPPIFIDRVAPYPEYKDIYLPRTVCSGSFSFDETIPYKNQRYSWGVMPDDWGNFDDSEIKQKPFVWIQQQKQQKTTPSKHLPLKLSEAEYALFDFERIECGFLKFSAESNGVSELVIGFSEYCENDTFAFTSINCHNVIQYTLPNGNNEQSSFEPYTSRFAIVMVKSGSVTINAFGIKTFERSMNNARKVSFENPTYKKLYDAAIRTFAHNAVDLYSDCPSRERAGWLCDSYFTGTSEYFFTGEVPVEDAFLENYRLCSDYITTKGMLPMCYPSDTKLLDNGESFFIPQWCMWYVLEVGEYLTKRNKNADPELFKKSVMNIVNCLKEYENDDGLLENLPSWNFVEWSTANEWTRNVNYPTNFLYSGVLMSVYELYGDEDLKDKAIRISKKTAELSFDGKLFTDNAIRDENNTLVNTGNSSEACQYYALIFADIDLEDKKYSVLNNYFRTNFANAPGDSRNFVPVNAFIGLYLRLKAELKLKEYDMILKDVISFFGEMADLTGTLWEYRQRTGSFDHGFASYAAYAMCTALENIKK